MIRTLGALVGAAERADELAVRLAANLERTRQRSAERAEHPKVYFEEWDEPMISGIGWVSELIAIAGGVDISPDLSFATRLAVLNAATGAKLITLKLAGRNNPTRITATSYTVSQKKHSPPAIQPKSLGHRRSGASS
jgi:hypothetical protein